MKDIIHHCMCIRGFVYRLYYDIHLVTDRDVSNAFTVGVKMYKVLMRSKFTKEEYQ